ncbi:hypothetical protein J4E90_000430 [Alternaria incomplexa]|uniref:uncharacterized protein n=1 Tax=Alternaria incomplexa TaxID=1187928 RepID=UPI00221FE9EA|nr:uncharacterized protein J4E90_000430 [Alternaria incomplexa]KAI4922002.1 hypothetical protein J4E90_000430 [Alternaria incomplexa]
MATQKRLNDAARLTLPKTVFTLSKLPDLTSEVVQVRLGHFIYDYIQPPAQADPCQSKIDDFFCKIPKTDKADNATGKVDSASDTEAKKNEDMFHVHKNVLCKTSAFFQAATKQVWRGRPRKPIDLTTENGEDFKYCITTGLRFDRGTYAIQKAYKGTMAGDPMRKLLLDFWIWTADETWDVSDIIEDAGKEFTQELLAALLAKRTHPGWFGKNRHMRPWTDPQTQGAYYIKIPDGKKSVTA